MDPVPRPEWAIPLDVGIMREQLTREALQDLCDDSPLLGAPRAASARQARILGPLDESPLPSAAENIYNGDMSAIEYIFIGAFALLMLASSGFWVWMLIECVTKEPDAGNTKICWTLIIVFTHIVGAAIYFVVRRDRRYAEVGH